MAEYVIKSKQLTEVYLKLHVGYKTKVKKRFEDISYVDCFGQFMKI